AELEALYSQVEGVRDGSRGGVDAPRNAHADRRARGPHPAGLADPGHGVKGARDDRIRAEACRDAHRVGDEPGVVEQNGLGLGAADIDAQARADTRPYAAHSSPANHSSSASPTWRD